MSIVKPDEQAYSNLTRRNMKKHFIVVIVTWAKSLWYCDVQTKETNLEYNVVLHKILYLQLQFAIWNILGFP